MTGTTLYLGASTLLGISQIVDARVLWIAHGKMSPMVAVFSLVELVWAVISFLVCRKIGVPQWLPLSLTVYVASFVIIGIITRRQVQEEGVPKHVILAGGIFGAYFAAVTCVYLIKP